MDGALVWLEFVGVAALAASGGVTSARKALDFFGACVVGAAAGLGAGTLRDLILDAGPVFWVHQPVFLAIALGGAVAGYLFSALLMGRRRTVMLWADAVGLASFAVVGASAALGVGAHPGAALLIGVATSVFGGLLRDVIVNDLPLVLREEIYAFAGIAGAGAFVAGYWADAPAAMTVAGAVFIGFATRAGALLFGWRLPRIGRPGAPPGEKS